MLSQIFSLRLIWRVVTTRNGKVYVAACTEEKADQATQDIRAHVEQLFAPK